MHKLGWLLIGLGALLLLGKGGLGFLLFPLFFFWPLALGALLFGLFARGHHHGYGWQGHHGRHGGPRSYYWRGRHGHYGGGCGPRVAPGPEAHDEERRANTGETTRL